MSGIHIILLYAIVILFSLAKTVPAAAGDLDAGFGTNGIVTTTIPGSTFAGSPDILVQPDGKLLICFSANSVSSGFNITLARYNPDGSLDTSFSGDGIVTSPFATGDFDEARALALQPDGKIVVAGRVGISNASFAVVRYNPDGSLDTTFDQDGIVTTQILQGGIASAVGVQTDGKIVAAGSTFNGSNQDFFTVIRYNANGSVDTSFGSSGIATADFGPIDFLTDLAIQPDGRILAAGTGNVSSSTPVLAMIRLNTNGTLDNSFDGDGRVASLITDFEEANSVDLQPDGKIVLGGRIAGSMGVFRYTAGGALDNTFNGDGVAIADFGDFSGAGDVRALEDGKLVAVGETFESGTDFALARFKSDGSLDNSFGQGGKVFTTITNEDDSLKRVAIQADGKIVGVGISGVTGSKKATLARYFGDSFMRSDFDGDGKTDVSVFRPSDGYWYLDQSAAGFLAIHWGFAGDLLATGDYDGDNKADTAVFRPSAVAGEADFYLLKSNGFVYTAFSWGLPDDIPVVADYDADGLDDTAVFRPSDGFWYVLTATGNTIFTQWGLNGDIPVTGDFDGDGRGDRTVYRSGVWLILKSSGGTVSTQFGLPSDKPVAADYEGDGRYDIAVFRPADGNWYALNSSNGAFSAVHWGQFGDVPVPGDYDGDGRYDQAVYRGGTWYLNRSSAGFGAAVFGLNTDIPTPATYPVSPSR
jgi:uncharacterized delta-60 repeat protein